MGKRFIVWLGGDISKAGARYNPGPKFSTYDSENVRKCQKAMGDTPDPPGEAFFGPRQWKRLFTDKPASRPTSPPPASKPSTSGPSTSGPLRYIDDPTPATPGLRAWRGNGKPKIILHTVEGPKPNWQAKRSGTPHHTFDGDTGTVWNHIGYDKAAYTLENHGDGPSPNSDAGVVIQIEMVGYAKDSASRSDGWYEALSQLLHDICKKIGCPFEFPLTFGGNESYGYGASSRLDWDGYVRTTGIIGHQHVPKNAHWDPGKVDTRRLK